MNVALNHAYGFGAVTGGFFPAQPPSGSFDLDHDQRLSIVANGLYAAHGLFASVTGIYGSGLTNGNDPDSTYGTRLFDFNQSIKVAPSFILNASAGYTFVVGAAVLRPQLYVDNALDHKYLLKGAFFSGASVGRPRSIQLRLNIGT
jgi:outer membrane receptor for Fe3+-dicitrate